MLASGFCLFDGNSFFSAFLIYFLSAREASAGNVRRRCCDAVNVSISFEWLPLELSYLHHHAYAKFTQQLDERDPTHKATRSLRISFRAKLNLHKKDFAEWERRKQQPSSFSLRGGISSRVLSKKIEVELS